MTGIQWLWELPKKRYSRLALTTSKQLAEPGDNHYWYAETQQWFQPPITLPKYKCTVLIPTQLEMSHLNKTEVEMNRVIRTAIIKLDNERTWLSPNNISSLEAVQLTSIRGWSRHQGLLYGYTSTACICNVIWQLQISSHQLEVELGKYACILLEERVCQLCHQGVEPGEGYIRHCTTRHYKEDGPL